MTDAAGYIRVSSKTQNYATQRDAIERAATRDGCIVSAWYVETRTATKRAPRPELERLLADVDARRVVRVYAFRLDRLTRLGIRDTLETVERFTTARVPLVTVADGLPPIEPEADGIAAAIRGALLALLAVCAQIEGLARSERVSAARERVEGEGGAWGRPSRMTPADVAKARALRAEGLTVREVAQRLQVPRATVGRALRRAPGDAGRLEVP